MDDELYKIPLENYFNKLISDNSSFSNICIDGIEDILQKIYLDLKESTPKGSFQKLLKFNKLYGLYYWKEGKYPIPIIKLKILLNRMV